MSGISWCKSQGSRFLLQSVEFPHCSLKTQIRLMVKNGKTNSLLFTKWRNSGKWENWIVFYFINTVHTVSLSLKSKIYKYHYFLFSKTMKKYCLKCLIYCRYHWICRGLLYKQKSCDVYIHVTMYLFLCFFYFLFLMNFLISIKLLRDCHIIQNNK